MISGRFGITSGRGVLGLLDTTDENITQSLGRLVVQAQVRVLFHDLECVAEFVREFRLRCADRQMFIVEGWSIGFLALFFHRRNLSELTTVEQ